jgi:hypothetical protein
MMVHSSACATGRHAASSGPVAMVSVCGFRRCLTVLRQDMLDVVHDILDGGA